MRNTQDFHIADWLPAGMGLDDVIIVLASLATLVMFFAMWQAFRPNSAFERRLEQIVDRKETLRQSALANRRSAHRRTPVGFMREAVTRLNLLRSRQAAEARQMLARAGFRSQDAMVKYLFAQISLPFGFGALILLGFGLVHAPRRSSALARNTKELDLMMLWRLRRSLRRGTKPARYEARTESSVKTAL